MTNCTDWDFTQVRDFDYLTELWNTQVKDITDIETAVKDYGRDLQNNLDLEVATMDADASKFFKSVHVNQYRKGFGFLDKE
jgi:hypothetical protein